MDSEYWISELTDADVPAVVALCRGALDLPEDAAEAAEIVLRLRERSGTVRRELAGFVALVAPGPADTPTSASGNRMIGVVLGSVSHRDPSIGHVDLIAVDPAERRRGVCRALMARIEGALAGLGAGDVVLAGNPPYYAWPGIDVRYTPAICAAMALGFEQDQPAWNMTADVDHLRPTEEAEKRLAERGITVRRAAPGDVPALADFAVTHFGSGGWAGEITDSVGRDGAGCHLAARNGEILGFAAYGSRPNWFGPMGTAPAAQGLGVGSVLLRRCLADQRAAGRSRVEIGWVGPLPFYSNVVGARVERVFFLYRKQL
ncbi:MAG TPA: GNAT family N-acetyltransferase [Actinoplanes sp.]|nr:GNAT family N-acetyltransferase [Actinoplanes sp.]